MTSTVTIYHIPYEVIVNGLAQEEKCCINLIDTPGFGDTRGTNWDRIFFSMIESLLRKFYSLDYIMLVVKASENRL